MKRSISFFVFFLFVVTSLFAQNTGFTLYGTSNATGSVSLSTYSTSTSYKFDGAIQISYPNTGDVPYTRFRKAYTAQTISSQTQIKIKAVSPTSSLKMKMGIGLFNSSGSEGTSNLVEISNNNTITDYIVNVYAPSNFSADQLKIAFSQSPGQLAGNFTIHILGIWIVNSGIETLIDIPQAGITPGIPVLTTPLDGATNFALTGGTLNWNVIAPVSGGIISYNVQVSTSQAFNSFLTNQNVTGVTSVTLNNLTANTIYYWRVSANEGTQTSGYSSARSFGTGTGTVVPDAPMLGAPADGATNFPQNGGTLNYTPVNGISGYQLELRENSQTGTLVSNLVYTSSPIVLNNLKPNTTYWWRVASVGTTALGWSAWRSFTTVNNIIVSKPILLSPANNSTGMVTPISFVWTAVSGVLNYELQICKTTTFSGLEYSATPPQNYQNVSILYANTLYYWRVRGIGSAGVVGEWSDPWTFMIGSMTEVDDKNGVPTKFELIQNYPNPFNPTTVISYQLPTSSNVKIAVYDVLGKEIAVLIDSEKPAGKYQTSFNAPNLSAGLYFYTIQAGEFKSTKKMILMK